MTHLRDVSTDPEGKNLAARVVDDEKGHEERVKSMLVKIAEDENRRDFLEKHFVQSWASQKVGVFFEGKELGIDLDKVLANFRQAGKR